MKYEDCKSAKEKLRWHLSGSSIENCAGAVAFMLADEIDELRKELEELARLKSGGKL